MSETCTELRNIVSECQTWLQRESDADHYYYSKTENLLGILLKALNSTNITNEEEMLLR